MLFYALVCGEDAESSEEKERFRDKVLMVRATADKRRCNMYRCALCAKVLAGRQNENGGAATAC